MFGEILTRDKGATTGREIPKKSKIVDKEHLAIEDADVPSNAPDDSACKNG